MAKDKKVSPAKSKKFIAVSTAEVRSEIYSGVWEVRRKPNKKAPDTDTETICFSATVKAPDIYGCCDINIEAIGNLNTDEFVEVIGLIENAIVKNTKEEINFFRLPANSLNSNTELTTALVTAKYFTDEKDGNYLLHEKPLVDMLPVYIAVGAGVGVGIGTSTESEIIGMCVSIAVCVAIGSILNSSAKKKRAIIKKSRLEDANV